MVCGEVYGTAVVTELLEILGCIAVGLHGLWVSSEGSKSMHSKEMMKGCNLVDTLPAIRLNIFVHFYCSISR